MIFPTVFTKRYRVLRLEVAQLRCHTVMQLLRILSMVPLQKEHMMGGRVLLSLICRGSRGTVHLLHSRTIYGKCGVLGVGSPEINSFVLPHIQGRQLYLHLMANWFTSLSQLVSQLLLMRTPQPTQTRTVKVLIKTNLNNQMSYIVSRCGRLVQQMDMKRKGQKLLAVNSEQ